jgi:hypothetical protein
VPYPVPDLAADVSAWLTARGFTGFRMEARKEWADRGEVPGAGARLTLVLDEAPALRQTLNALELPEFDRFLADRGYFWDFGHVWTAHLYPLED